MHIRDAKEADLPSLLAIHNDAIRTLDAIWIEHEDTMEDRRQWFLDRKAMGFPVVLAVDDNDTVLGYGSYGTYRGREGYRLTVEHSVYLFPEARGKGVGKALLSWLIEKARADGLHAMVAVIDASNAVSIDMHEKFGFESSGVLRQLGQKWGKWLDQVQMVKLLDDRAAP
ncbi:MAG: GNAT family N-acetyltransferase [Alphaproteobacteria bacterium]|nr:GNAT family N-acetyltransferase [Alphaproteobacteria bacterium]